MKKQIFIIVALLAILVGQAQAVTYSVGGTGAADDATCVDSPQTHPCATIQYVFDNRNLAPADIVEICADTAGGSKTYTEAVSVGADDIGDATNQVTIRGRAGDSITINGNAGTNVFLALSRNYLDIENISVANGSYGFRAGGTNLNYRDCHNLGAAVGFRRVGGTGTETDCTSTGHSTVYGGFSYESGAVATNYNCVSSNGTYADVESHGFRATGDSTNITMYNPVANNNPGDGFNVGADDALAPTMTIYYGTATGNGHISEASSGDGYTSHGASTLNVYYSTAAGNYKSGAAITGIGTAVLYNNSFYNNYEATAEDDYGIWINSTGSVTTRNNIVKNHRYEVVVTEAAVAGAVTLDMDYDLFDDSRGGTAFFWNGDNNASLADWKTDATDDTYTVETNGVDDDPDFTAAASYDFTLFPTSPALGGGAFVTGFHNTATGQSDKDGEPVPPYDIPIGAYNRVRPSGGILLGGSW